MRAIVSVLGNDRPGIIATVSGALYELGANILDISQTVMQGKVFTMSMLIDLADVQGSFHDVSEKMQRCGEELGMDVRVQREEIFASMYRV